MYDFHNKILVYFFLEKIYILIQTMDEMTLLLRVLYK